MIEVRQILILALLIALSSCATVTYEKPIDRFTGLANPGQITASGKSSIDNAKKKTVAIVKSENVNKQLATVETLAQIFDKNKGTVAPDIGMLLLAASNPAAVSYRDQYRAAATGNDRETLEAIRAQLSSDRLITTIVSTIKSNVGRLILADDLPDAFQKGADYAVVLDLALSANSGFDGGAVAAFLPGTNTFASKYDMYISAIFVDKSLFSGPDVRGDGSAVARYKLISRAASDLEEAKAIRNAYAETVKDFDRKIAAALN